MSTLVIHFLYQTQPKNDFLLIFYVSTLLWKRKLKGLNDFAGTELESSRSLCGGCALKAFARDDFYLTALH